MTEDELFDLREEYDTICIITKGALKRMIKTGKLDETHIKMLSQMGTRIALLARRLERQLRKEKKDGC